MYDYQAWKQQTIANTKAVKQLLESVDEYRGAVSAFFEGPYASGNDMTVDEDDNVIEWRGHVEEDWEVVRKLDGQALLDALQEIAVSS